MMTDLQDIKQVATPRDVARYFLGMPSYERGGSLWYCSPFRNEEHPSFKVDDVGMYDFGSNKSYDIFGFVQGLKHCSFKESVELLANLYGVADRDYESKQLVEWYKKQRKEQEEHRAEVHSFYLAVWDEVDSEYQINEQCLSIFKKTPQLEAYKICLDKQVSIWGMEEYLTHEIQTLEDKEKLMLKAMKGELPTWLMDRLKMRMMTSQDLLTEPTQKREY